MTFAEVALIIEGYSRQFASAEDEAEDVSHAVKSQKLLNNLPVLDVKDNDTVAELLRRAQVADG